MTITIQDVEKIARLSRIYFSDSEKQNAQSQLNGIFNWIDKLQEVDVSNINLTENLDAGMHEREDTVKGESSVDKVLANAPQKEFGMYVVPKVVE